MALRIKKKGAEAPLSRFVISRLSSVFDHVAKVFLDRLRIVGLQFLLRPSERRLFAIRIADTLKVSLDDLAGRTVRQDIDANWRAKIAALLDE